MSNSKMSKSNDQLKDNQNLDYSLRTHVKFLVNNEEYSDVSFSVGKKGQLIYGHKMVLAKGSPVMNQMFKDKSNESKNSIESKYPIKVTDLTPDGFINMLRYMYGHKIDFDLSVLFDVYMASNKYLVNNLSDKIFEYIESKFTIFNCCLIYDQLLKISKIKKNENLLNQVKAAIIFDTKSAFSAQLFKKISKEAIIDILNFKYLNIDEIDILKNCLNWIEAKLIRNNLANTEENKRSIFSEIKPFIKFSQITIEQLKDFKQINSLLNSEEIGNLFLHLADNDKPIPFECKTSRKIFKS